MKSLLARLLLVVSVALVPALAFQAYTEGEVRRIRQQFVEDEALRLVRLVSSEQQQIVEGAEQVLNAISSAPAVQDNVPEGCRRLLANLLDRSPRYNSAAVLGLDGHVVCAQQAGTLDAKINESDPTSFRHAVEAGGFAIGEYTIGRTTGQPALHMAKPFTNRDGIVAGVVDVALNVDWLGQHLKRLALPPGAAASVADRNGTVLARYPDGTGFVGQPIPAENRFALAGDEIKVFEMTSQGHPLIVAYSPPGADPKGLLIKVGLDRQVTFGAVTQANLAGLLLIVAGGALALAIAALLGTHLIRRPVNRLLSVADRWRTGDLAARSGIRADSTEFGRLAAAFDRMAAAQEAREHTLHTALESTTDSVMMFDRDWRITYLSERARTHVAQGRDLVGKILWEALPGTSDSVFADAYRTAMERGVPTHTVGYSAAFETWFEAHAYPSGGSLTVFFRDVTEERRITAELAGSEARLRLAQEAAGIGIWEFDFTSRTMFWSPEQYRLYGVAADAGQPTFQQWLDLVHPEDRASILDTEVALQAPGAGTLRLEFRIRRGSDEACRWLASLGRLVRDDAGRPSRIVGVNLDVTDRRRAEEDVRRATALLRAIGNCSPDPIYAKDTEGCFLFANPAALAVIGKPADEVIGRTDAAWHSDPEQAAAVMANDRRVIQTGQTEIVEEAFLTAGLGTRVYRSAKAPLRAEDGMPLGVVVVSSDITQIKDAEAALRESEQRLRKLFDGAPLPSLLVDPSDAYIVDCNDAAAAMLGYERDVLRHMRLADIDAVMGDDELAARKRILSGEAVQFETRHRTRSGELRDVVISAVPVDSAGRRLSHATVVDITERKRAEVALRESEVRLQLAREAAGLGIMDYDVVTGAMIWSEEHWRLHGLEPQPSKPDYETWRASVHLDDIDRVETEWGAALADPAKPFDTQYRVVWPDETHHWLLAKATITRGMRGEAVRVVGLSLDVTASRNTEAELRRLTTDLEMRVREEIEAREEAQARAAHAERMQALGQLAGGIAHDFNNVLQAVEGAALLIERRPGDETGVRRLARVAIEAAGRGASITRRLLAFARRGDLRAESLDVAALLSSLHEVFAHTLGTTIEVHVRQGAGLPPILADKGQLETVLVNLATNARDAMPDGGRLTLSAETEIVSSHDPAHPAELAPGRYVRLVVADTGIGMDAATLAHVGEPFFTTKPLGVGTGLGLPMAKGFARQSGGALNIQSRLGTGTRVTLWLPEARSDRRTSPAASPAPAEAAAARMIKTAMSARLLVVDDEDLVREMLAEHLEDAGFGVMAVASASEALALLAAGEAVDALVTDLSMPGMDGVTLIRAAQERRPGLPAVLLTGYAGDGAALAVGGAVTGAFSLLRKPIHIHELVDRIQALLAARTNTNR